MTPSPSSPESPVTPSSTDVVGLSAADVSLRNPAIDAARELASIDNMVLRSRDETATTDATHLQSVLEESALLRAENERLRQQLEAKSTEGFQNDAPQDLITDESSSLVGETKRHLAEAIFEQSHDAILLLNHHQCVSANDVATRLLDRSAEELKQQNFYKLLTEIFSIDNSDWSESLLQQLTSEGSIVCELCRETPAGEMWIELRFRTLKNADETAVLVTGHDISRLRKFQKELVRSHDFLHHTINSVQQPLSVKSADFRFVLANDAFCDLLDMPFDRIHGRTFCELVGTEATYSKQLDEQILETGDASVNVEWLRRSNGSVTTLSTYRSRFHDPVTGAAFIVTAARDVTVELATQRRLRLLASVFENAHESVAILGNDGTLHEANPEFIGTVGVIRKHLMGRSLKEFVDWEAENFENVVRMVKAGTPWFGHVKLLKAENDPVSCWLSLSPSRNRAGEITNMIAMFSDITQIESTRSELHRQALHDNLTSLPNRRYYRQRITELIESDTSKTLRFGVSFLDLDDFKIVNDSLGHDAGDQLLIEVSRRIQKQLGDECFMARFGGDEFALLLPEVPGTKSRSQEYSALVVNALCEPFQLGEHEVNVGVSVGTTLYPDDGTDVESLMRQADVAMYRAKDEGKNKVRLFSPDLVEVIEHRQSMLSDLRKAIDRNELHVVYQPKLELATNQVVGCEALLRWRRPDGTNVSPDQFIPLAEESGLINRLGDQMFDSVCQQAKRWNDIGLLLGPVAVNLTQRQLREPQLLERFIQAIELHELQPEWLELEITENAIMSDIDRAISLMNRVREYGIRIAIDDFGTGYSSLAYIKNFPVQCLKLDNLFVDGLPDEKDAVAVAKTVISLADGLNLEVIAEGVETEPQREFLKAMGCEMAQGYLISPPLEADDYQQWLIERSKQ